MGIEMRRTITTVIACSLLALAGCGNKQAIEEYYTQTVTLPNGKEIRAEVVIDRMDIMRGLMFRDSLAPDRGMLFVHGRPDKYTYWMYQVKIPLDIIWMDANRRIVEISANTPPCQTQASKCPHYGGNENALFVLELAGGVAAKHGLQLGDQLTF